MGLKKIIAEEIQETLLDTIIVELLEGVGDKYAQKFGVPDDAEEFEKRWQVQKQTQQKDMENGTFVGQVYSTEDYYDDYQQQPINVYKNPVSLKNFQPNVRAIGDKDGNLYVAQIDGNFYHENIIDIVPTISSYTEGVQLYRAGDTNMFGVAGTYLRNIFKTDDVTTAMSQEHIEDHPKIRETFVKLNNKQPFDFSYYPTYMLKGGFSQDVIQQSILREGVADKYAEKKWGIPDERAAQERQANKGIVDSSMGEMVGQSVSNYNQSDQSLIYKNPTTLKNFEAGVRAVSDLQGNLFVAQHNGDFVHKGMQDALPHADIYRNDFVITWHRVRSSNIFGYSDSFTGYGLNNGEEMVKRLELLRKKHPAFRFVPQYYNGIDVNDPDIETRAEPIEYFESSDHREMKMPEGMAVGDNSGYMQMVDDGVGDKYAEKAFHIKDVNREFEKQGIPDSPGMGKRVADISAFDYSKKRNTHEGYIYQNPESLQGFGDGVRALGMLNGDLYVAQRDGDFTHAEIHSAIEKRIGFIGDEYVGMHRVGKTNVFGAGDSMAYEYEIEGFTEVMDDILYKLENRHPQFEFNTKYFISLKNKNFNDIIREEIQNTIKEIQPMKFNSHDDNTIVGLDYEDGEEGPYGDKYIVGQIRIEGNDVEVLDWNSTYKSRGGTEVSLKRLRDAYGGEIRAVDAGYPGEESFSYWMHMMKKGLVDGVYDDNTTLYDREDLQNNNMLQEIIKEELQNIPTPQEIADNLVPSEYWNRMKANNPKYYQKEKPVLANVDMKLADEAFRRDHDFYISPDDRGIGNRKERVLQTIEDGTLKYAPDVSIRMSHHDVPVLSFGDGRHRFAVLRDLGVQSINMTFSKASEPYIHLLQKNMGLQEIIGEEIGLLKNQENNNNHAILKRTGKKFWIGCANTLDGYIEEVHTYEEAERSDFHHSFYFSPNMLEKISNEECMVFWVDEFGINGEWTHGAIPQNIINEIHQQINIQ